MLPEAPGSLGTEASQHTKGEYERWAIYVKVGFATEEDDCKAAEKMAQVGADIVEDTDVLPVT